MRAVVITNCTGRKRAQDGVGASVPVKRASSVSDFAQTRLKSVQACKPTRPVRELYVGRSVVESVLVSDAIEAMLLFVSAGLGLVEANEHWPLYNLTVSKGEGSIFPTLTRLSATPAIWWNALNASRGKPHPIRALLRSSTTHVVLLALPSGYLEMVSEDLNGAREQDLEKLRVFTSSVGIASLTPSMRRYAMPYDARLEAVLPGTKGDFPQRAMRHFVETLGAQTMSASQAHATVSRSMAKLAAPEIPTRAKASDEDIASLLAKHWPRYSGQSSKLLRFLRDDALIACEQGRFRDLWRQVRSELEPKVAHG